MLNMSYDSACYNCGFNIDWFFWIQKLYEYINQIKLNNTNNKKDNTMQSMQCFTINKIQAQTRAENGISIIVTFSAIFIG